MHYDDKAQEFSSHFPKKSVIGQNISSISISFLSDELCAGDSGDEYPYCIASSYSNSITFSRNIKHQSEFNTGIFSLRFSLSNHVVKSLGININIMLHTVLTFNQIFHRNYTLFNVLFRDILISVFIKEYKLEFVGPNINTLPPHYIQL